MCKRGVGACWETARQHFLRRLSAEAPAVLSTVHHGGCTSLVSPWVLIRLAACVDAKSHAGAGCAEPGRAKLKVVVLVATWLSPLHDNLGTCSC